MFLTAPSSVAAGQVFNPAVRVAIVDPQGNTVSRNNNADITLYLNSVDPRDTLLGTVTLPTAPASPSSPTSASSARPQASASSPSLAA